MHVMSVEYLRPMMGASPSSDQLQQQLSQNTRGHCRPSTREGGKGGAHRARALSAAARGPHLSTRNPRPKESARLGGQKAFGLKLYESWSAGPFHASWTRRLVENHISQRHAAHILTPELPDPGTEAQTQGSQSSYSFSTRTGQKARRITCCRPTSGRLTSDGAPPRVVTWTAGFQCEVLDFVSTARNYI